MSQTLTSRVNAIKNTPGSGEQVQISELNSGFDKFDNHFIPACKIQNTSTQIVGSGPVTQLQYDAIAYDSYAGRSEGAMADLSNDRIIIRRDGLYHCSARIWTTTPSAAGLMFIGLYKNDAGEVAEQMVPGNSTITQTVEDDIDFEAGDIVTVKVIQTSGANRTYARNTWPDGFSLAVTWVGALVGV